MAARKPKPDTSLAAIAERQIIALYDAGVLSPAVLQHVIAAYAQSGIDWGEAGKLRTVDDHSVQEAVVLIMMPGRALRSAQKDFVSVVEHLAGKSENVQKPSDDEDLLSQLGGGKHTTPARKSAKKPQGFNPLVGARAVEKS
jgi:hypothetical protein